MPRKLPLLGIEHHSRGAHVFGWVEIIAGGDVPRTSRYLAGVAVVSQQTHAGGGWVLVPIARLCGSVRVAGGRLKV